MNQFQIKNLWIRKIDSLRHKQNSMKRQFDISLNKYDSTNMFTFSIWYKKLVFYFFATKPSPTELKDVICFKCIDFLPYKKQNFQNFTRIEKKTRKWIQIMSITIIISLNNWKSNSFFFPKKKSPQNHHQKKSPQNHHQKKSPQNRLHTNIFPLW